MKSRKPAEEVKTKPMGHSAEFSERTQWLKKDPLNDQFPYVVH